MNPVLSKPIAVSLSQVEQDGCALPHLFCMRLDFGAECPLVQLVDVHVPPLLQTAIKDGVTAIYREVLEHGSLASRVLPGEPSHLVTGVVSKTGGVVTGQPRALVGLTWGLRGVGLALSLAGTLLVVAGALPLLGMLGFAGGVLALKASCAMPNPHTAKRLLSQLG